MKNYNYSDIIWTCFVHSAKNMHIILGIQVKYCTTIAETATPFNAEKVQQFMFHLGRKRIVVHNLCL